MKASLAVRQLPGTETFLGCYEWVEESLAKKAAKLANDVLRDAHPGKVDPPWVAEALALGWTPPAAKKPKTKKRGLTLLELMIGVSIFALIASFVLLLLQHEPSAFEEQDEGEDNDTYISFELDSDGRSVPIYRYRSTGGLAPAPRVGSSKYPSMPRTSPNKASSPTPRPSPSPKSSPSPASGRR